MPKSTSPEVEVFLCCAPKAFTSGQALLTPEVEAFLCYAPKAFTSGQALHHSQFTTHP
jgi:hypothetical protein